jgi:hypothetical protein
MVLSWESTRICVVTELHVRYCEDKSLSLCKEWNTAARSSSHYAQSAYYKQLT